MVSVLPSSITGRLGVAAGGLVALSGAGLLAAYFERGPIGVRLATDYFRRQGVEARLRVDRLDADGFVGAVSLGPRDRPDFSADRVEVRFGPIPPLARGLAAPPVRSLRLVRPRLRVQLKRGRLGFGSLQRIIDQALARPGSGPGVDAQIVGGLVQVYGDLGPLAIEGDGALRRGELDWARLRLRPTDLRLAGWSAHALGGGLEVKAYGPTRATLRFQGAAEEIRAAGQAGSASTITGTADLTHAPRQLARLDGPLHMNARLAAGALDGAGLKTGASVVALAFSGAAHGTADRPNLSGRLQADALVSRAGWSGGEVNDATIGLIAEDAVLRRAGAGWAATGRLRARIGVPTALMNVGAGRRLRLTQIKASTTGQAAWSGKLSLALNGELSAAGGLTTRDAETVAAAVPVSAPRLRRAVARALQAVRLEAPAFALALGNGEGRVRLDLPVRLVTESGATLTLGARPLEAAAFGRGGASGSFDLALSGANLPRATAAISRYRWTRQAGGMTLDARVGLSVTGDLPPVQGASVRLEATVAAAASALRIEALGCAPLQAAAIGAPRPSATAVALELCPASGPLLALHDGRWRAQATLRALALTAPAAAIAIDQGEGRLDLSGGAGRPMQGALSIARLRLSDVDPVVRFRPITTAGTLTLAGDQAQGALQAGLDSAPGVRAAVRLSYDVRGGRGSATLDAPALLFGQGRLQPADLLPALGRSFTRVKGPASVFADARWSAAGLTTGARIRLEGVDVKTMLGPFTGVRGELVLTSLTPLVSAPGQRLTAQRLETILPLTDVEGVFALRSQAMEIAHATATLAKGGAELGPMSVPLLDPKATLHGTVRLHGVDFAEVDSALNLSNAVSIQSRIDGVIPFAFGPAGLRVSGGRLFAVSPGRLSIRREALTGGSKAGAVKTNAVQDFAYQALENLAFDTLTADVDSKPKGRLGVLFHIRGRHDPPAAAPTRVGLLDLIRGRAFDKAIPLPKGTPVDLTLDTSLNLDEVLAGYRGLDTSTGSAEVQR